MKDFNINTTNEETWLTPPEMVRALGNFDLDPCTPDVMPWKTAEHRYTKADDGLLQPWFGRVWMNPPYGREIGRWIERLALHGTGTTLVFNRTDTAAFQEYALGHADSMLLVKGRIRFYDINGNPGGSAPAPSVFFAYGEHDADMLEASGIKGRHIYLKGGVFIIGLASQGKTWQVIVGDVIDQFPEGAELSEIYDRVVKMAPDRVRRNKHYKAKIRQTLYFYFNKTNERWQN